MSGTHDSLGASGVARGPMMTRLGRVLDGVPPSSGGAIMGTAIVSVGLRDVGRPALSAALLAIAAAIWLLLALLLLKHVVTDRARIRREAATPELLTSVAGTGVLGTRLVLEGWVGVGVAALAVGGLLALVLVADVLRRWQRPTVGVSFLVTVAVQSLAVLCAVLATAGDRGLVIAAIVLFVVGLGSYPWILRDFDLQQLVTGRGDHWIVGGALALTALASGEIVAAIDATGELAGLRPVAVGASLVVLAVALAWIPPLVIGELLRPRLRFSAARWGTVFPLGMYAAVFLTLGATEDVHLLTDIGHLWVWAGAAVWVVVAVATVRVSIGTLAGLRRPSPQS